MKYKTQVIINKDIKTVIREFTSKEASFKWIDGLESFDLIEGRLNEVGSKYKMVFRNKNKTEEMIETITDVRLPNLITTTYEMGSVWNECINTFEEDENHTKYMMETDFKFGFPLFLFIWLFRLMFKKQTLSGMMSFKKYVESLE